MSSGELPDIPSYTSDTSPNGRSASSTSVEERKRDKRKQQLRDAQRRRRENQTEEQRQAENRSRSARRANQTPEQKDIQKKKDAQAKAASRARGKTSVNLKDAFRSQEIMEGKFTVLALEETEDAIGPMNHVCRWCEALKFKGETMSCCCGGPVDGKPPLARPKWYLEAILYQRQKEIDKLKEEKPIGYERDIEMIEGLCKGCKVNWCKMYQRCDCEEYCNHTKLSRCCIVNWFKMYDMACKCDD